jgi:hypothetical protein
MEVKYFKVYWIDGKIEVLKGLNIRHALEFAKYSNDKIRNDLVKWHATDFGDYKKSLIYGNSIRTRRPEYA